MDGWGQGSSGAVSSGTEGGCVGQVEEDGQVCHQRLPRDLMGSGYQGNARFVVD